MTSLIAGTALKVARGLLPRVCVALAILGLLAPSVSRFAGPDGPAWFPGHGHIFLSHEAARHGHAHPWDDPAGASVPPHTSVTGGVVFTLGDLDAASALAMVALPAFALLLAVSWQSDTIGVGTGPLRGLRLRPVPPPPQT
ncbi:MAG: hypothetical protein O2822_05475 [Chloroflexi bacterium]|nr:hypothetical protein [Chloroflexota bacterium]